MFCEFYHNLKTSFRVYPPNYAPGPLGLLPRGRCRPTSLSGSVVRTQCPLVCKNRRKRDKERNCACAFRGPVGRCEGSRRLRPGSSVSKADVLSLPW